MSRIRYSRALPYNYNDKGVYAYAPVTGIIGAGISAASEILQFRWNPADTGLLAVIQKVTVSAAVSTTYFAAGVPLMLELVKSTAWSAAGTGGASPTTAALLKRKTSMASTAMVAGDLRIATTAALGAGTKTLETYAQGNVISGAPITSSLSGQIFAPGTPLLWPDVASGEHPLVLAATEGFSVRVTAPGTGTWTAAFQIEWAETLQYPFGT